MTSPWDHGDGDEVSFGKAREPGPAGDTRAPGDRVRLAMVLLAGVSVLALLVTAVVVWRGTSGAGAPQAETHGLSYDHAACFAFGTVERRMEVMVNEENFEALRGRPPPDQLRDRLREEVDSLDDLASRFPGASYRLVDAFSAVADGSTEALNAYARTGSSRQFFDTLQQRFQLVATAAGRCRSAGFDTERLEPLEG